MPIFLFLSKLNQAVEAKPRAVSGHAARLRPMVVAAAGGRQWFPQLMEASGCHRWWATMAATMLRKMTPGESPFLRFGFILFLFFECLEPFCCIKWILEDDVFEVDVRFF
jgi:hypothetical protein